MRRLPALLLLIPGLFLASQTMAAQDAGRAAQKEWTFLVFLNGHNNLDSFGAMDINEMEKVGSTDQINVVVQWASSGNSDTRRLLVKKDNFPNRVTSPVVQSLSRVDMGDWRSLVEFVRWGAENYPAKRYFVAVWDHGSGWHRMKGGVSARDISWDEESGHNMTTEQLGDAMREIARLIGHKVDVYGSDACLMAMAEVAGEMSDAVEVSVGSEEVEPGEGWPYDTFLARWTAKPTSTPAEVGKMLTETYLKSYQGGSQGTRDVTFSAFDLTKMDQFSGAVRTLGSRLRSLNASDMAQALSAANSTLSFTYGDYGDLLDFVSLMESARVDGIGSEVYSRVRDATKEFVIASGNSSQFERAGGVAIWLPTSKWTYDSYAARYKGLRFHAASGWGDALAALNGK